MANEDMNGLYFGGGAIDHVVTEGDIFLRANQVARLIGSTGVKMAISSLQHNDPAGAGTAQFLMLVSEKIYELRSELLKREIEDQLPDVAAMSFEEFYQQLSLDIDDPIDPASGWMD